MQGHSPVTSTWHASALGSVAALTMTDNSLIRNGVGGSFPQPLPTSALAIPRVVSPDTPAG
eukprot:13654137-Alexandrium_andersonii.AAC.1